MNKRLVGEVYGRVQGVSFRAFIKKYSKSLDLKGTAINTDEGTVKFIAEGDKAKLEILLNAILKGPVFADVYGINYTYEDFKGEFNDFEIERTEGIIKDQLRAYKNFANSLTQKPKDYA